MRGGGTGKREGGGKGGPGEAGALVQGMSWKVALKMAVPDRPQSHLGTEG